VICIFEGHVIDMKLQTRLYKPPQYKLLVHEIFSVT